MNSEESTITIEATNSLKGVATEIKEIIEVTKQKLLVKQEIIEKIIADYNKLRIKKMSEVLLEGTDTRCDRCEQTLDPNETLLFQSGYGHNEDSWKPTQIKKVCRDCSIFLEARDGMWTKCDCRKRRQSVFIAKLITSSDLLKKGVVNYQREEMVAEYLAKKGVPPEIFVEKEDGYIRGIFIFNSDGKIDKIEEF